METLSFWQIYFITAAGIVISIVLPILKRMLPGARISGPIWEQVRPFLVVGAFSLLTALLIVAMMGENIQDWRTALLAGYAWDSTLQKVAM